MKSIEFGPGKVMQIDEPLDTWLSTGLRDFAVPEAVGSSARVFKLFYKPLEGDYANFPAVKIMRPDKQHYALPLFENEVKILTRLAGTRGITPLLATGFLKVHSGQWPQEIAPMTKSLQVQSSANQLEGEAHLFTPDETNSFLKALGSRTEDNWLAFMILPRRWEDNLYLRCDAGYTRGGFHNLLPTAEALKIASQILKILETAHTHQIVYLDHKILHYYWNEPRQQVFMLDWNIGRIITNGDNKDIFHFDVLQFSARALHHLLTGRQAPGTVKVGPNRPEDIENAPEVYEPVWTYDDQKRLTEDEMDVLTRAIHGNFETPGALAEEIQNLYNQRQSAS